MALVQSSGYAHVRLTVTDINRSKDFYDRVFGWPAAIDASDEADDPEVRQSQEKFYGGVVYQTPQGTLFGLRPVGSDGFDSTRTGLDHLSFAVESRADMLRMPGRLRGAGSGPVALHLLSSCPMGEDRALCATDSYGRVHGVEGLHVADASLLCTPLGVNPQGSVLAMARRNALHFLGRR